MSEDSSRTAQLLDAAVGRLAGGNKGFPATKALLQEAFELDRPASARLAVEMVALILEREDADAAARGADVAGAAGDAEGAGGAGSRAEQRHGALCVLILDAAFAANGRPDDSCGAEALRVGRRMPVVLRKLAKLGGVALSAEGPARQDALEAAAALARRSSSEQREAAFLLADAHASEPELERLDARALLDALVRRAQWAAAERLAGLSESLRRQLIDTTVRARELKRAHGYVCAFGWGGRAEYEDLAISLEMTRVVWLVRSGHVDLVRGALRDVVQALRAFGGDAPYDPTASASAREPAPAPAPLADWPLSMAGTVELLRQMLRKMADHRMDLEQMDDAHDDADADATPAAARGPAARAKRPVWLVRALCPPWREAQVAALWQPELAALAQLAPAPRAAPSPAAQPGYLRLPLAEAQVRFVARADGVEAMVADLERERRARREKGVVGFDSEWRATGVLRPTRCALLQLASARAVWLLDLHALFLKPVDAAASAAADAALTRLFADEETTKLAFGLREELRTLHSSYPHLDAFRATTMRGGVCLRDLYASSRQPTGAAKPDRRSARKARAADGDDASAAAKPERRAARTPRADGDADVDADEASAPASECAAPQVAQSLSAICADVLGGKLEKTSQMSDWERRPLTAAQRHYAALDAHCLVELYARLSLAGGDAASPSGASAQLD